MIHPTTGKDVTLSPLAEIPSLVGMLGEPHRVAEGDSLFRAKMMSGFSRPSFDDGGADLRQLLEEAEANRQPKVSKKDKQAKHSNGRQRHGKYGGRKK